MKTKILFIVILVLIFLLPSCSNFLIEDPRGQQMVETFYKDEKEALSGLMGLYFAMIGIHNANILARCEASSDLLTYKTVASVDNITFNKYRVTSGNAHLISIWSDIYASMFAINSYIEAMSNNTSPNISANLKMQYINEAKFFRALLYYHLVMSWGDVPLLLKPDASNIAAERTPVEKVWKAVLEDLNAALSLPDKSAMPNGRITKGAVQLVLAKVHLMMGNYQLAKQILDQITGYSLMPSIKDVWSTTKKYNNESIWEVNRTAGTLPQQGNGLLNLYLPLYSAFSGPNATYPVNDYLIEKTEKNSPRSKYYYSIKPLNSEVTAAYRGEYTYTNASGQDVKLVFNNSTLPLACHLMKFSDFTTVGHTLAAGNCSFNIIVFRYADVVLLKAECEMEANNLTTALALLNQIRERGGETKYTMTNEAGLNTLADQAALREAIRNERALELVGEGHRFYDLKRWGASYALAKIRESRQVVTPNTAAVYAPEDLDSIEEYRLLWPIIEAEIQGNPAMVQNPGY